MMATPADAATMIATLGGKPELVTLALDVLLRQGEVVDEVIVVHPSTANPRIRASLQRLLAEFAQNRYTGRPCKLSRAPLKLGDVELDDIRTDAEAAATQLTVLALIAGQKQRNRKLHLCLAGGRRMMALLVMSAAALLCDHRDRLWHVHGSDAFKGHVARDGLLHAAADAEFRLVPIPIVPWGTYFPALRAIA
ncbi:MAG: hypothetical protein KDE47_35055 [Caldilineaceae bacterium]|nr:hypothetical protein [Caldilineaceae bacterium]